MFHNFQIVSKKKAVAITVRAEWSTPSLSDLDYYLFHDGAEVGSSTTFNPFPRLFQNTGGEGFEQIRLRGRASCDGFTLESRPWFSPTGEDVTLKVWLG
ncbi:MAG: hypothetical protein ACRDKB_10905 [Actinomycetota bacterium]